MNRKASVKRKAFRWWMAGFAIFLLIFTALTIEDLVLMLFINAFCDDTPPEFWREVLIDTCDGGCSWGVVYNVATGKFSYLEMNGVA